MVIRGRFLEELKLKILTVIGARPQFVKTATVSREIKKTPGMEEIIVHTGQHFDKTMSDVFFKEMEIPEPNYNLNVNGLTHGAMTGQMLEKLDPIMSHEKPDCVLVCGDTNSTLAGALCGSKMHIPVAHIEAGLRSFNMRMPEEINRIIVDRISNVLFCPTDTSFNNLMNEGFDKLDCKIVNSGDVMFDAAMFYAEKIGDSTEILYKLSAEPDNYVLCTIHRAENTDDLGRLRSIIDAINEISLDKKVVLPLHPRTKKIIEHNNIPVKAHLIDPVGYFDMLVLIKNCSLVMTDSGGLQKESYFFGKRCITLRDETEWVELVNEGANELVGSDHKLILESYYKKQQVAVTNKGLYGNGKAASIIVETIRSMVRING
jgi:UDP-GlcNAc3NAcA epimerase